MDLFLLIFCRGMRQPRQAETRRRCFKASCLAILRNLRGTITGSVRAPDANRSPRRIIHLVGVRVASAEITLVKTLRRRGLGIHRIQFLPILDW